MKHLLTLLLALSIVQTSYSQQKTSLTVQLSLQNQTGSPYFCAGSEMLLVASPVEQGLTYQWFRDGQPYQTTQDGFLRLREAGTYHVLVSDAQREGISDKTSVPACPNNQAEIDAIWKQALADVSKKPTDPPATANSFTATVTSQNPVLCNGNSSAVLVAFPQGTQYSYQWQRADCMTCTYNLQSGQTNDTLTTTSTGFWRVLVTQNTTIATSNPLRVASVPYATLTDQNDNPNGIVNISAGQSASLKVSFVGQGPYVFSYSDGLVTRSVNTTTNPHTLAVTAFQNTRYTLTSAGNNACGTSGNDLVGNVRVITDPTTSVSLSTPINLNVCAGSTVSLPYTKMGTWTTGSSISVRLINEIDGSTVVTQSGLSSSPLQINVPSDAQVNRQYRVSVLPIMPVSVLGPVNSTYLLTVTSTGCTSKPIITTNTNPSCGNAWLYPSYPSLPSGTTFQWVKDGSIMSNETSSSLLATQSGNYYIKIRNTTANYNDSSAVFSFTVLSEITSISSPNPLLCGSNTNAVLTANVITAGGTYQWFRNSTLIANATNSSYTATTTGTYSVQYTQNGCTNSRIFNVNNYANATLTTLSGATSATVSANQPVQLRATFEGQGPWTFQLGEGVFTRPTITTNSNPYTFTVQPDQNLLYRLTNVRSSDCSFSGSSSSVLLTIDPTTTVTLPTPLNLNVCAGSTIQIPFTQVGTWGNGRNLSVNVFNVNASNVESFHGDSPITYTVPSSLSVGTSFRISVEGFTPFFGPVYSTYQFTVNSTGCSPTATIRAPRTTTGCDVLLLAYPSNSSSYQYQWFRNGVSIGSATDSYYYATQSGSYTVQITNTSGYNSTSAATNVTVTGFTAQITSPNGGVLCNGLATLNVTPADTALYTYQWRDGNNNIITGATTPNLKVHLTGSYSVFISRKNGGCSTTALYSVTSTSSLLLTDTNNNSNATITTSPGQSVTLRLKMSGQSPFHIGFRDELNRRIINTSQSLYEFTVTPTENSTYRVDNFGNSCGLGNISGQVRVIIDPTTSVILPTPSTVNICAGSSIEIPYTQVGIWGTESSLIFQLLNASGNVITSWSGIVNNPATLSLPSNLALNSSYRIRITGITPFFNSVTSTYQLTVTSNGCLPDPVITMGRPRFCNSKSLFAPFWSGYSYEWYREGVLVGNSSSYTATIPGSYTLRAIGNGYDRTSTAVIVNFGLPNPTISSTGTSCSNGVDFTLSSSVTDPNYIYQWYFAPASSSAGPEFLPIAGGTSSILTTNQAGAYFVTVENGACQALSNTLRTCESLVNFRSASICQGGSVENVSFSTTFSRASNNVSKLQLVNATTGSVVIDSLVGISGTGSIFNNVALPNSVPAGAYRFVVSTSSPVFTSSWSAGVLTITNSIAPAVPTLTAMPTSVTPGQSTTLSASACTGTVRWADSFLTATSRTITPTATAVYTVTCIDANGCMSAPSSVTVTLDCDPLEPNNNLQTATTTSTATYNGPDACLDNSTDQDWYSYVHNNLPYFIRVYTNTGCTSCAGRYKLSVNVSNDTLIVRTLSVGGNNTLSAVTLIELYSFFSGTNLSLLGNGQSANYPFSTLRYKLPAPCPQNLSLYSTILDIAPNQSNTARATRITATNKVGNGAMANYYGQSSVLLSPGFETQLNTGGTFKAEVRGCND